ncbi:MAG: AsmA family protein, partial [Bacteroidales bacterium]
MKKVIHILTITLALLLILLITLPFLFKSKIEGLVKQEINKQVEATVNWSKFSLTFFRGFPDLSVNLHELSVVGKETFEGDTLLSLNRFELRVSPFTALKKKIIVKSILLNQPLINAIVLADGSANYDIVPPAEEEDVLAERPVAQQSPESQAAAAADKAAKKADE